jgi:hypothetical protein
MLNRKSILVTVAGVLLASAIPFACVKERPYERPLVSKNLKEIMLAIDNYYGLNGALPYDDRGPEYALYNLRDRLDASYFDATAEKPPEQRAYWDHQEKCLRNGDYEYWNEYCRKPSGYQVIMMAKSPIRKTLAYLGFFDGSQTSWDFPLAPDRRVLGSWVTVDSFLIHGAELYAVLASTHVVSGHEWTTAGNGKRMQTAEVAGLHITYRYSGATLSGCTVKTAKGVIDESFETDDLGQIIGCTRSPEKWDSLLP